MVPILIAVKPRMYREVIALSIHNHRPNAEVLLCPPEVLHRETGRFEPHVVVLDYNDGATLSMLYGVLYRVEILLGASMDARISVDGQAREVKKDICMEDLLAVVDEAEKRRQRSSLSRLRATLFLSLHLG